MEFLKFEEAEPSEYPDLIPFDEEDSLDLDTISPDRALWLRLESYICHRWTVRQCVWTVKAPGCWEPHLSPVSNVTVDQWDDTLHVWESATPDPSPLGGYVFSGSKVYRITADVGANAGPVPQLVIDAYLRLAAYMENTADVPSGVTNFSQKIGDGIDESTERSPNWIARALQYSGCADLLRQYRMI